MWHIVKWEYALDLKHGLGLLYHIKANEETCKCFFEDGTLSIVSKGISRRYAINKLCSYADLKWPRLTRKEE